MAFTVADDLTKLYSAMTTANIYRMPAYQRFVNRAWQAELQNAYQTTVQRPDLSETAMAARTRNADWADADELGATQITLKVDQYGEAGFKVHYLDSIETPWAVRAQSLSAMTAQAGTFVEDNFYAYLGGLATALITDAGAQVTHAVGDNDGAGKIALRQLGSSTNKVTKDGVPANDTAKALIFDALVFSLLRAQRLNLRGGVYVGDMPMGTELSLQMPPELFNVFAQWLLNEKYDLDALTSSILQQAGVFSSDQFMGELLTIHVVSTNALAAPDANDASKPWVMYASTPKAVAFSDRPMRQAAWSPWQNETSPANIDRLICEWSRGLINNDFIWKFTIPTA